MDKKLIILLRELHSDIKDIKSSMATKDDLKNVVAKKDLPKFREEITEDIAGVINDLTEAIDERKVDKKYVNHIEARVNAIETKIAT